MENLPLPDASLDVLVCVYCFHEMPEAARAAAAKEWFR
jgi:ubiquinone/menaquinone biosynthesis C-methylase UbiE